MSGGLLVIITDQRLVRFIRLDRLVIWPGRALEPVGRPAWRDRGPITRTASATMATRADRR